MSAENSDDQLMQSVLQPLLEDFQHWFQRSSTFLEQETVDFLSSAEQQQLRQQVEQALGEVKVAATLLQATDGQAGVEARQVMGWHRLVHQCWGIAYRHRQNTSE